MILPVYVVCGMHFGNKCNITVLSKSNWEVSTSRLWEWKYKKILIKGFTSYKKWVKGKKYYTDKAFSITVSHFKKTELK